MPSIKRPYTRRVQIVVTPSYSVYRHYHQDISNYEEHNYNMYFCERVITMDHDERWLFLSS